MRKTKTSWLDILSVIAAVLAVMACAVLLDDLFNKPFRVPIRYVDLVFYCAVPIEIIMIISCLVFSVKSIASASDARGGGKVLGLIGIVISLLLMVIWSCIGFMVCIVWVSGPPETPPTECSNVIIIEPSALETSETFI